MTESILWSSLRAFFIALSVIIGLFLGIFLFALLISLISGSATEPERIYTKETVANADNERKTFLTTVPVILQLNIDGIIGADTLTSHAVQRQLIESREGDLKDNAVKAILLQLNTPGGTVVDADGIYRALKYYKEQYKVPIYAYVDGLCASGGMYVACAADKVFASDSSIIGSVGVISPSFFNLSQLLDKVGVQALTLYAGKGKDELNPMRPWKPGEEENFQKLINYYYQQFVNIVSSNRPEMSKEKLVEEYGAKVFNPQQAQEYGYINGSGYTRRETLKQLLKQIGVEDDKYEVVELQKKTWYSDFISSSWNLLGGKIELKLPIELDSKFNSQFLYLYRPE